MSIQTLDPIVVSTNPPTMLPAPRGSNNFSMRGFSTLLVTEARVWSRDLASPIMCILFPTLLIAANAIMGADMTEPITSANPNFANTAAAIYGTPLYGNTMLSIALPTFMMWGLAMGPLSVLPGAFAAFRDKGVMRRFAASPMRPGALIGVHILLNAFAGIIGALLAVAVAHFVFGSVADPQNIFTVIIGVVLALTSMCAVGALIGSRSNKSTVASGIGTFVMFVFAILSNAMGAGVAADNAVARFGQYTPFGAAMHLISEGWFGTGFPWVYALVLLAWTVIGTALAAKLFKWS